MAGTTNRRTPPANGRHRPAKAAPTTPTKTAGKRPAKPRDAASARVEEIDPAGVFGDFSVAEFVRWEAFVRRLPGCPGFRALQEVVDQARKLRALVVATMDEYGQNSGSVVARFFAEFGREEIWGVCMAAAINAEHVADVIDSRVPLIR